MNEWKKFVADVNGYTFTTMAKTERKAKANIRYQAARAGLAWCKSADIEVKEVA